MEKQTSLKELGFRIEPIKGKDAKGNEWIYRVRGKEPVFYIKRTKHGKLLAYKDKNAPVDSTINGLYDFQEHNGDLVGRRFGVRQGPQHVSKRTGNTRAA